MALLEKLIAIWLHTAAVLFAAAMLFICGLLAVWLWRSIKVGQRF